MLLFQKVFPERRLCRAAGSSVLVDTLLIVKTMEYNSDGFHT